MNARLTALAIALLGASAALAAPKIDRLTVKPNPAQFSGGKPPEVEVAVEISRGRFDTGSCDVRVDFGDGQGRTLDFGMAKIRSVRHVYSKNGSYTVMARGAGGTPCEGMQQAPLTVAGAPEPPKKKAEPKKAEPEKKVEAKKKAAPKKAPAKKKADEKKKKPAAKKAPAKKADEKKKSDEKKKAEPK